MLRKTSASIFLVVMSLLIALHSPVLGYCAQKGSFFLGDIDCAVEVVPEVQSCPCSHEEEPAPIPVHEEHELISLDSGDFLWSAMADPGGADSFVSGGALIETPALIFYRKQPVTISRPTRPPPPDLTAFRRFSVLRL